MKDIRARISELAVEFKALSEKYHEIYVTAESLTAGYVCAALVEVPGSSAWFDRGFITYSNEAKKEMLGVKKDTLETEGSVSKETSLEMAGGSLAHSSCATMAVSVTGIAGPDGGTPAKPVGTVWISVMRAGNNPARSFDFKFSGDRETVRLKSTLACLIALKAYTIGVDPDFSEIE